MMRNLNNSYYFKMNKNDHIELLEALINFKGPVILSGYESQLYDSYLEDWHKITFKAQVLSGKEKTEVLWCNFEPPMQMNLFEGGEL